MAGTYLIARAMGLLAEHGDKVLEVVNDAVTQVWHGQMRELEGVYHIDRTEEAYLEVISQKTAALYQLPCAIGAMAGAKPCHAAALRSFGQFSGIAFQIVDDILDFVAEKDTLGKPAGGDIKLGVYTLPVIRLMAGATKSSRLRILLTRGTLNEALHHEAIDLVRSSGAIGYAVGRAKEFVARALNKLDLLPESPAVDALRATSQAIIERTELKAWNE
jgi:geranylgeranyl pyrophosphate synthase